MRKSWGRYQDIMRGCVLAFSKVMKASVQEGVEEI
jgi:hypothetical protein